MFSFIKWVIWNFQGRPMMEYPLLAALHAQTVDEVYVSTDSVSIKEIAFKCGAKVIEIFSFKEGYELDGQGKRAGTY